MLYVKGNYVLFPTESDFIYELDVYDLSEKGYVSLIEINTITSKTYIKEERKYNKSKREFSSLTLLSAPEDWLIREGYEPVGDLYGVKTRFIKKD